MTTILVSGAIANKLFNGGEAWVRLSWLLGFRKLGCRVSFVEQIAPETCVDTAGAQAPFEESLNLAYFKEVMEAFDMKDSAALVYGDGEQVHGLSLSALLDVAAGADLLVNISGHLTWEPLLRRVRRRAYIDIDPGFTQFWHADGLLGDHLEGYDAYFTIGENIGTTDCEIPAGAIPWRPTRQPVVLEHWPVVQEGSTDRFTTIANWRGPYGSVQVGDRTFGLKLHEFRKFIELPQQAPGDFEIALNIHPAEERDLDLLQRNGWQLVDPSALARDPLAFRRYVQGSSAEFSVAQGIYVETNSGWFSDRTVRYLVSGKPVLVQETGFSRNLPVGEGLLSFCTLDEAIEGAERITSNYPHHSRAARAIAEKYFDSDRVLGELLDECRI